MPRVPSRRHTAGLALAGVLILLLPGRAAAGSYAVGQATSENVILSVAVGDTEVAVASDIAESESGDITRAHASFVAGATTDSRIGVAEKTAEDASEAGTDSAAVGALSVDDLLDVTVVGAGVDVDIDQDSVTSSATGQLADANVLDGLLSFDGLETLASTGIDATSAVASRSIALDGVELMRVGPLFDQLGIDPYSMECGSLEDAGATLGVDTDAACEDLATIEEAIADANAVLAAASADLDEQIGGATGSEVAADRAAAAALSCGALDLACIAAALTDLTNWGLEYSITLSNPTDLEASQAEIVAGLDELRAAIDDETVVDEALTDMADGTCQSSEFALAAALDDISDEDPAGVADLLAPIYTDLTGSCDDLDDAVERFLATPLLSFDGIEVAMDAAASENASESSVELSIGAVRVGVNDSTTVSVEDAEVVADQIGPMLEAFFADLGFGFAAPVVELLVVDTDNGQDADAWFADASLTTVRLTLGADSITVPDDAPLGVLDGAGGSTGAMHAGIFGVAAGALLGGVVPSPQTVVEAGVFSVGSTFAPAAGSDDDGDDGDDDGDEDGDEDGDGDGDGNGGSGGGGSDGDPSLLARTGLALLQALALALLLMVGGAHAQRRQAALAAGRR